MGPVSRTSLRMAHEEVARDFRRRTRAPQNAIAASNSVPSSREHLRRSCRAVDAEAPQHRASDHHRAARRARAPSPRRRRCGCRRRRRPRRVRRPRRRRRAGRRRWRRCRRARGRRGSTPRSPMPPASTARAASSPRSRPLTTTGSPLHSPNNARSSNVIDGSKSVTSCMMSELSASSVGRQVRVAHPVGWRESPADAARRCPGRPRRRRPTPRSRRSPRPRRARPAARVRPRSRSMYICAQRGAVGRGGGDVLDRVRRRHRHDVHGADVGAARARRRQLAVVGEEAVHRGRCDQDRRGDRECRARSSRDRPSTRRAARAGRSAQRAHAATFSRHGDVRAAPACEVLPRRRIRDLLGRRRPVAQVQPRRIGHGQASCTTGAKMVPCISWSGSTG